MTQNILSALDSDNVDSIDETVESIQVAELVREAYYDLMSQRDWPFLRLLTSFTGLGDTNNPTKMLMPENINKVFWVKYNKKEVVYLDPEDFKNLVDNRTASAGIVDSNGYVLNQDPSYWTSYDDKTIVFDGYNSAVDNSLQQSKSDVYGVKVAVWEHTDAFIPDIPEKFFATLLAEAKAQAFVNLKQQSNAREERKAQRGRVVLQNEAWRNDQAETRTNLRVNYGRR